MKVSLDLTAIEEQYLVHYAERLRVKKTKWKRSKGWIPKTSKEVCQEVLIEIMNELRRHGSVTVN